jgi:hypothetical protein
MQRRELHQRRDILAAYAANVWWIVTWITRAYYWRELGWHAYFAPVKRSLAISSFTAAQARQRGPSRFGIRAAEPASGHATIS